MLTLRGCQPLAKRSGMAWKQSFCKCQAIMDSQVKGNKTAEAIWDNGTKPISLTDHTPA
jgi:hypothetical protein